MAQRKNKSGRAPKQRLKRNERGDYILPNGEIITVEEQKAFRSAVVSANAKRNRLINQLSNETKKKYYLFGHQSDFIIRKKTTALNRFRTKNEFNTYYKNVRAVASRGYINRVVNTYRSNLIRAFNNVFNSAGQPLVDFVNSLSNEELRNLTLNDAFADIGYVYYEPVKVENKLKYLTQQIQKIRAKRA